MIMTAIIASISNPVPAQTVSKPPAQTYTMTTPIAPGVAVPDKLDTSIGTLNLSDGYPAEETVERIYDNLDRSRAPAGLPAGESRS